MSTYTPREVKLTCELDHRVPLNEKCADGECATCGWNPEVNAERRKQIHMLASRGKLREEWGKEYE